MKRRPRRNHTPVFKAKVALAALKGGWHCCNQITTWKAQLESGAADVFEAGGGAGAAQPAVDVKTLHAKIGELTLENDFLERSAQQGRVAERKAMIDRAHELPITKQAAALGISRGSVYDRLHLEFPFAGLADAGRPAGCRGVQDRPPACQNVDAADDDARARSQDRVLRPI
jgi:putative transposase